MPKVNLKEFFNEYRGKGAGKLFSEAILPQEAPFRPVFNLGEDDTEDTYSFKRLFLQYYKDPQEVEFVDAVLGGRFDLWKAITEHKVLKNAIQLMREEARARFLADNYKSIVRLSETADAKTSMAALKFLCSSIGGKEESSSRGRPSKREIQQRTNEILSEDREIQEAFTRVQGLN